MQPVEEQVGQQERSEVVEGERLLESVRGEVAGVPVATDVVDEHIEARERRQHLIGQPSYL